MRTCTSSFQQCHSFSFSCRLLFLSASFVILLVFHDLVSFSFVNNFIGWMNEIDESFFFFGPTSYVTFSVGYITKLRRVKSSTVDPFTWFDKSDSRPNSRSNARSLLRHRFPPSGCGTEAARLTMGLASFRCWIDGRSYRVSPVHFINQIQRRKRAVAWCKKKKKNGTIGFYISVNEPLIRIKAI